MYSDEGQNEYSGGFSMCEVICDDRLILITENLFDALCQLASSKRGDYLWADALCIDQTNLKEKASQVLIMGEIYARASQVIVWLGKSTRGVYEFATIRETLVHALRKFEAQNGEDSVSKQNLLDTKFLQSIGIESVAEWRHSWHSYFQFFQSRRWFRRAWIVQEIALAGKVTFLCGDEELPSKSIYELGIMIRAYGWRHALADIVGPNPRGGIGDEADRLLEYREQVRRGGPNDPHLHELFRKANGATSPEQFWISYLQHMVQELRRFEATDERNYVYAVLGLAKRFMPSNMTDPLQPDYSLTCEQLYISATRIFIEQLPLLSSLSYVGTSSHSKRRRLPSWVPDYSSALRRVPFIHMGSSDNFDASCTHTSPRERPRFEQLDRHLILNGAVFGYIAQISPTIKSLRETCMVVPYINMCLNISKLYQPTNQDRVEVLWRTLIADTSEWSSPCPALPEYGSHFHDWILTQMTAYLSQSKHRFSQRSSQFPKLSQLIEDNPQTHLLPTAEEVLKSIGLETIDILETDDHYSRKIDPTNMPCGQVAKGFHIFDQAVKKTRGNRRMFRTEDGHLGLGDAEIDPGDDIWLLQGARVPFILRPLNHLRTSFHLIGEAYLHGFMHGEMLSMDLGERIVRVTIE